VEDGAAWVEPGVGSTMAFVAIVALVIGLFVAGLARVWSTRGAVLGLAASALWVGLTGAYVAVGVPATGPPGLIGLFATMNVAAVALAFSPVGTRLIEGLPLWTLAAFQGFRLPLELVLHAWGEQGTLPVQMTFEGHNFDIVTGVCALALAGFVLATRRREAPRWMLWAFNVVGTALLAAVIVIVLLSSPLPIKTYDGPPILLALHLPYAWIAPVCVAGALAGHLMLWRGLFRGARGTSRTPLP